MKYMARRQKIFFIVLGFFLLQVPLCIASETKIPPPVLIAHAGGGYNQKKYTNSREALDSNYDRGFRFFEIDFSWTSDGYLVAIHDWDKSFRRRFGGAEPAEIPTKSEFLGLKAAGNLTPLSMENVLKWAEEKGDAFIVTDVKAQNIRALKKISNHFKEYKKYVIPQVYSYKEYDEAAAMGFENIILTLYRMKIVPFEVLDFARRKSPFAITMPWEVAAKGLAYHLQKIDTTVYAHTVNDWGRLNSLRKIGVFGVYTDFIVPP